MPGGLVLITKQSKILETRHTQRSQEGGRERKWEQEQIKREVTEGARLIRFLNKVVQYEQAASHLSLLSVCAGGSSG